VPDPYPHASPVVELVGGEVERSVHRGGAVVQLVDGDPASGDATVVEVHPATVVVTSERVIAVDGDLEWSWLLADIEALHHGRTEPWTIVVVPGVDDHGVSVPVADVLTFRRVLAAALAGAPSADEVEPSGPVALALAPLISDLPGPAGSGVADPLVEEHAIEHHAPPPDTHADDELRHDDHTTALAFGAAAAGIVTVADLRREDVEMAPVVDPTVEVDLTDGATLLPPPPHAPPPPPREGDAEVEVEGPAPTAGRRRFRGGTERRAMEKAAAEAMPLAGLEAREISAWFGTHHVLDRVSLVMEPGEVTALIGPSGCGKSTFLRILNRMHEMIASASLAGEVLLDGEDIYDAQKKLTDARRQIGMVFQKPNPFPAMSIYDNVVASYRLTGTKISSSEKDEVVESCLTKAGLWTEVRDRLRAPGGGLSGGQQQRLCIARALAIRPRVLLMDEPCSALDPTSTRRIEETIMELGSEVTIVIVTHNMQQAARVSDQCAFFLAEQGTPGVIVEHGPTDAMFQSPQDPRTYDYVNGRFG
jgi:phosphate transport system ATP-binding protein